MSVKELKFPTNVKGIRDVAQRVEFEAEKVH
jgi:hypothetical protein